MKAQEEPHLLMALNIFDKDPIGLIREHLAPFKQENQIRGISHLYQKSAQGSARPPGVEEFVVIVDFETSPIQKWNIEKLREQRDLLCLENMQTTILCWKTEVWITAALTIPNEQFHLRPDWVIPSAELYPEYVHPILKKKFRELATTPVIQNAGSWGEFHMQSSALLV